MDRTKRKTLKVSLNLQQAPFNPPPKRPALEPFVASQLNMSKPSHYVEYIMWNTGLCEIDIAHYRLTQSRYTTRGPYYAKFYMLTLCGWISKDSAALVIPVLNKHTVLLHECMTITKIVAIPWWWYFKCMHNRFKQKEKNCSKGGWRRDMTFMTKNTSSGNSIRLYYPLKFSIAWHYTTFVHVPLHRES